MSPSTGQDWGHEEDLDILHLRAILRGQEEDA